jgi:hypothetical protein
MIRRWLICLMLVGGCPLARAQQAQNVDEGEPSRAVADLLAGKFLWKLGAPLLAPAERGADPCYSVKDPSIVRYNGKWHLFCTIRSEKRSHQIEYVSFDDFDKAGQAERHILKLSDGYFCAPQVFYFEPHRKWYLLYQIVDKTRKPELQPAFSTTDDISKPESWSKPTLLFEKQPDNVMRWIDFWIICDDNRAYLFFTSNDGQMWRAETALEDFPKKFSRPRMCLKADIFEASHTYKLKGMNKYLTIVEAQDLSRRYYKAYISGSLNGGWDELATSKIKLFAAKSNIKDSADHWADSISHGELLRAGYDQRMEVDPQRIRFLFQGVSDELKAGKAYGQIPWRLGLLVPEN